MGENLRPLLGGPVGLDAGASGGIVGHDRAKGALKGVVASRSGRDVDHQTTADGLVELAPDRLRGPAALAGVALAAVLLPTDHSGDEGLDISPLEFRTRGPSQGRDIGRGVELLADSDVGKRGLDEPDGHGDADDRVKHGWLLQTRGGEGPKE